MIDSLSSNNQKCCSTSDRRKQDILLQNERRSGFDRRNEIRMSTKEPSNSDVLSINGEIKDACDNIEQLNKLPQTNTESIKNINNNKKQNLNDSQKDLINFALSPVPLARRIVNIEDNSEDNNKVKAAGLGAIALINAKEDARDLMSFLNRTKVSSQPGHYAKFGFFTGTVLEKRLKGSDFGKNILDLDKTIGDIKIGKTIEKILKIDAQKGIAKKEITHLNGTTEKVLRKTVSFTGSKAKKTLGLAMYRMPILSLAAAALLELPSIIKAKKQDKLKQTANSALSVTLGATCGALCSALLAPYHPALAVMGLGMGSYLGNKLAKAVGFQLNPDV